MAAKKTQPRGKGRRAAQNKLTKRDKPKTAKCPDCGAAIDSRLLDTHLHGQCESHTCELCNTVTSEVIRPNVEGKRLCADCRIPDGLYGRDATDLAGDLETEYDGDEEDEEDESGY